MTETFAQMNALCFILDEQFCSVLVDKCEKIIKDHVMKIIITRQLEEQPTSIHQTTITSLRAFYVENKTRMIRPFYSCKNYGLLFLKRGARLVAVAINNRIHMYIQYHYQ